MPQFLHNSKFVQWVRRIFTGGSNTDIRPEMLKDGMYTDALNMRPVSVDGNTGGLEAVQGETLLYQNSVPNPETYTLIGSSYINGHLVEFWASEQVNQPNVGDNPPLVRIDGDVMAQSINIPYVYDRPLQIAPVEKCGEEGMLWPADHYSDPLYWDIGDMIAQFNAGSEVYFAGYTTDVNSVALNAPPSWPLLDKEQPLIDLGSGVGLPVGQYSYSLRYVDINGNRTNWSPETPLIPVPAKYTPDDQLPGSNYPGGRTFGGVAGVLTPTPYGINLRFRVDNVNGYASVEIKRRRYNEGGGLLAVGVQEVVYRVGIEPNFVGVLWFVDPDMSNLEPPEIVPDPDSVIQYVRVNKPKSVDYSDGRVKYFNFRLEPKKLEMTFTTLSTGLPGTSITKKLTRNVAGQEIPDGYSNPYNSTYYKSAQRGEKYGYEVQGWDGAYGKYPSQTIPGLESYQHPNQRDIKGANGAWAGALNPNGWGVESDLYSDDPCYATTTDVSSLTAEGPVGKTFAAMTQGTQKKTDTTTVLNVALPNGSEFSQSVGRSGGATAVDGGQFWLYSNTQPPQVQYTGDPDFFWWPTTDGPYKPWDPRDNQADGSGYNIPPVTSWLANAGAGSGGNDPYGGPPSGPPDSNVFQPAPAGVGYVNQCDIFNSDNNLGQIFGPTYHSLGLLLGGISDIPDSVRAITITRTEPAGRVVMQGMGTYDLDQNVDHEYDNIFFPVRPATKRTNGLLVHFPAAAAGIVNQATIEEIQQFPDRFSVQIQCGVGFHPEVYGYTGERYDNQADPTKPWAFRTDLGPRNGCLAAHLMDQVSYARVMEDHGQVNPGETAIGNMGYQPIPGNAPPGNYVGFDKWRSNLTMDGTAPPPPDSLTYSYFQQQQTGNALFSINDFQFLTVGPRGGSIYRLITDQSIYAPGASDVVNGSGENITAFQDPLVRAFHQPWFVVNIVRNTAEVPDAYITPTVNTGATFAIRQCIGVYQEANTQQDFRLEDDYEYYNSVGYLGTDFRYTYIQQPNGLTRRFLCVTNNTIINVATILIDIINFGSWTAPDGLPVYGVYEAVTIDNINYLRFGGTYPTYPVVGSRIEVRYPEGTPIRVFGHDVTIAPTTHAVMDYQGYRDFGKFSAFNLGGLPLPYPGFGMNPRYFMPELSNQTEEQIFINYCASIRQWCVMWDAESRVRPEVYANINSTSTELNGNVQMFLFVHYVMRPYAFAGGSPFVEPAGFFEQYKLIDYPLEYNWFDLGGLRFQPGVNLDYARPQTIDFFGWPQAGVEDKFEYCTGYIASLEFDPIQQDVANLRTFLFSNMGVLSDETGEIKVGSTYLGGGGQNTVVWTQKGVARILTNKNVLTGASGEQVSTQSISNYWGEVMFLSRNIGLPDQLWRLWTKAYATAGDSYMDTFYWPNRKGWFRMRGDQIDDIARNKQLKKLVPILEALPAGYFPQMSAFFNTKYQEMWATISPYTADNVSHDPVLVVYSPQTGEWLGEYSYRFDGFQNTDDGVVGMRDLTTWQLDNGFVISGNTREAWVYLPIVGELGKYKEMVRWRAVGDKPDGMQLFDKDGVMMSDQSEAIQEAFQAGTGALWAKLYDSYEGQWWRTMATYDAGRRLPQDVRFFVKVLYNTTGDKTILALENQLKNIR